MGTAAAVRLGPNLPSATSLGIEVKTNEAMYPSHLHTLNLYHKGVTEWGVPWTKGPWPGWGHLAFQLQATPLWAPLSKKGPVLVIGRVPSSPDLPGLWAHQSSQAPQS